ncbi:MAG: hypothetical protein HYS34_06915, partial [Acidobacteria bacterium]|nr:hypothetical protein [Acidobacteriota bacterium]
MRRMKRTILVIGAALALGAVVAPLEPAHAEGITRVRGTVKDINGKPLPKVKLYFEAVNIKKRVGPVTTNKEGVFVIATLD